MSALATVTLTVSFALVKHMVSTWLGDNAAGQVGQDLLDLCRDRLAEWGGSKDERAQLDRLAVQVVADMTPLWETESRSLDAAAKTAVVLAVGSTIAGSRIDAGIFIQYRLDAERLAGALSEQHKQQIVGFSGDEQVLYRRLLLETCRRIVYVANHMVGYAPLVDRHMLLTLDQVLNNLEQLLAGPSAATREFEQEYRIALPKQLNRFDTIGVAYAEDALHHQRLEMAYVGLRLEGEEQPDTPFGKFESVPELGLPGTKEQALRAAQLGGRAGTIQEVLALSSRLVIRGQPGSGKSTLLRWLAVHNSRGQLAQDSVGLASWDGAVPFYLRLRTTKQGGIPTPQEWPKANGSMLGLEVPPNWMHGLLRNGRAVVLIDGVDEVSVQHRKLLLENLQELVANYPLARYVITSRPAALKNWPEWNEWMRAQGFLAVSLQEMEQDQVFAFIDQWHDALLAGTSGAEAREAIRQLPARLKQLLRNRLPLRRLARNPLLCTMICALHRDRPNNMPQNRVKLYQDCVEMLLYKRDSERGVVSMGDYPPLTHTHEEVVLREYAHHLLLNGESEEAAEDVDAFFNELLLSVNMPGWDGPKLRDYFVTRTGLLIEPADGQVAFAHRTFQEYLAAKVIVKKNEIKMLLGKARDDQWRETILLAVAIPEISEKQSEKLFRGLLKKAEDLSKQRSQQELYLLAVACMESPIYLPAPLRAEIVAHAATVIPPRNDDEVALIAKAGDPMVELLRINPQFREDQMAQCVAALAEIGSQQALAAIAEYSVSEIYDEAASLFLRRAVGAALWRFDPTEYRRNVLVKIRVLSLIAVQLDDVGLAHLAGLTNLQSLDLRKTQVGDAGLAHLAGLTNLRSLDLRNTQVGDAGLANLAGLTNLQSLNLRKTQVGDAGLVHLACLANLQSVCLTSTDVSDAGLVHLVNLTELQSLDLVNTQVSDAGLAHLAGLTKLQSLYLDSTRVSDAGLAHLAGLTQLQSLGLTDTQVGDVGLAHLAGLTELQLLSFMSTQVGDVGLAHLAGLTNLQWLDLDCTQVSDAGLAHLVGLTNLRSLDLRNTQVDDAGLAHLAGLTNLQSLVLDGTRVGDAGLAHLAGLTKLQSLELRNTQVSDAGLAHLAGLTDLQLLGLTNTQVNSTSALSNLLELRLAL